MMMTPRLRKFALLAHVTSSVGWLGAVAAFLALAIAGLISQDAHKVGAAYLAMELTTWFAIVPLALASLLTGLVSSLGTKWGLFRYYWVLVKFLLTTFVAVVLLLKIEPISFLAGVAAETTMSSADHRGVRMSLVAHAGGGLVVLLVAAALGIYKPWSMTRFGRRKASLAAASHGAPTRGSVGIRTAGEPSPSEASDAGWSEGGSTAGTRWRLYVLVGIVLLFVILHLLFGGVPRH